jgi:deoxyribose-phosphate aldolase
VTLDNPQTLASLIDHTFLKPESSKENVVRLCSEAKQYSFASVCINPCWVRLAADELASSQSKVCTVIGFPLGANRTSIKIAEAETALADGATELDMVINLGLLRSRDYHAVYREIADLASLAHNGSAILKVILETSLLNEEEKTTSARLAKEANADFVKTSTGFSTGGATVEDVRILRAAVGQALGVKASGGVRSLAALEAMVAAGATRIGTSSGISILQELTVGDRTSPAPASVSDRY